MRYRAFLKNIEQGLVFKRPQSVRWRCRNCGFIHEGAEAPAKCPCCEHPRAFFELLVENY
jgi:rubrerythrin